MRELREFLNNTPFAFLVPYLFPTPALRLILPSRFCGRNRKTPPSRRQWSELESPKEEEEGVQGRGYNLLFKQ